MLGLGAGEILGSLLFGSIADKLSYEISIFINIIAAAIAFAMMILYCVLLDFSFVLACIMNLTWGIQDAGINCLLNSLLGFQFASKTTPFSVFRFLQALLTFIFIAIFSLLNSASQTSYIVFFCACAFLAIFSWIFLLKCFRKLPKEEVQAMIEKAEAFEEAIDEEPAREHHQAED